MVGHKSVVLEGARLEKNCVIGPNSVVPPGRVIPSGQLWAGNPVQYGIYYLGGLCKGIEF